MSPRPNFFVGCSSLKFSMFVYSIVFFVVLYVVFAHLPPPPPLLSHNYNACETIPIQFTRKHISVVACLWHVTLWNGAFFIPKPEGIIPLSMIVDKKYICISFKRNPNAFIALHNLLLLFLIKVYITPSLLRLMLLVMQYATLALCNSSKSSNVLKLIGEKYGLIMANCERKIVFKC